MKKWMNPELHELNVSETSWWTNNKRHGHCHDHPGDCHGGGGCCGGDTYPADPGSVIDLLS